MLDPLVLVTEKIVDLARERRNRRKGIFDEFYREIFDKLSQVHTNYLVSIQELKDELAARREPNELKAVIARKRAEFKASRDHIESTIRTVSEQIQNGSFDQNEVNILTEIDTYMRSYFHGRTGFTGIGRLIDEVVQILDAEDVGLEDTCHRRFRERTFREHMEDELNRAERWLEKQFSDICVLYNNLRVNTFYDG